MTEYNLPDKDDAPWLNATYDGFMTHEEMLAIAAQREAENEVIVAKVSEEDFEKVMDAATRQELANKTFEELTKDEKIKLALEELNAIVLGGQNTREFYLSVSHIRNILERLK